MNRLVVIRVLPIWLAVLAGCAAMGNAKYPQTPDEFLSVYNWGGIFQEKEKVSIDRPLDAVVADVRVYAKTCLDININKKRQARYATGPYGQGTGGTAVPYKANIGLIGSGATVLSVQEIYDNPPKGTPHDGMYTLVAEIQSAGRTTTDVTIYHLAKPFLADPLKKWVAGDRRDCPAL